MQVTSNLVVMHVIQIKFDWRRWYA